VGEATAMRDSSRGSKRDAVLSPFFRVYLAAHASLTSVANIKGDIERWNLVERGASDDYVVFPCIFNLWTKQLFVSILAVVHINYLAVAKSTHLFPSHRAILIQYCLPALPALHHRLRQPASLLLQNCPDVTPEEHLTHCSSEYRAVGQQA
jgi:hypothetical protein